MRGAPRCARAGDEANQRLLERLNASGRLYLTHTRLDGRLMLRFAVGAPLTQRCHVEAAWAEIREEADALLRGGRGT